MKHVAECTQCFQLIKLKPIASKSVIDQGGVGGLIDSCQTLRVIKSRKMSNLGLPTIKQKMDATMRS